MTQSEPHSLSVSIVVPTFGREEVLTETIGGVLKLCPAAVEIVVVDQTQQHKRETVAVLQQWHDAGRVRWIRLPQPSIPHAMNVGLAAAKGDLVLFLDDDIAPSRNLLAEHLSSYGDANVWAVTGQVLQPGECPCPPPRCRRQLGIAVDLDFCFRSDEAQFVRNVMAGNLSVRREQALAIGGFDENFIGVAYRFETEFARRIWGQGGTILFNPGASINHLRAPSGGSRSHGHHLTSASPMHGVGDYYFALRQGVSLETVRYVLKRPLREVRTRFHLAHPWWIPVKLIGELHALLLALRLVRRGPAFIGNDGASPS